MNERTFDLRLIVSPTTKDRVVRDVLSSLEEKGYECLKKGSQKSRKDDNELVYFTLLIPKDESEMSQMYLDANTEVL